MLIFKRRALRCKQTVPDKSGQVVLLNPSFKNFIYPWMRYVSFSQVSKMKAILNIILLLLSFEIQAQTSVYHPFPDSNAIWRISWGEHDCLISGLPQAEYRYILEADTIINSVLYKKIKREIAFPFVCGPTYPQGIGYMGGLRQDEPNRKVYFIPRDSINEKLIYDFNLSVGDTLPGFIFNQYEISNTVLLNIDSILIDTSYRIFFITNNGNNIIEGIGLESGLLEAYHFDLTPHLICFIQDSLELYKSFPGISCELITKTEKLLFNDHSIKIYPNPFHKNAIIEFSTKPKDSQLIIYNQLGDVVHYEYLINKIQSINCDGLTNGIYFYKIIIASSYIITGKLIRE